MVHHVTTPAIKVAPMIPPTTPPAIPAVFEEDDCGADDASVELVGVGLLWADIWTVVWTVIGTVTVVGTVETLPVTSGESPARAAAVEFQLSPGVGSRYAHLGTLVSAGMEPGKVPAVATEVQFCDHEE